MTKTRTISGIPDELWEKALNNYDNVSARIKELLEEDLEDREEKSRKLDLLEKSGLTDSQKKAARKLLEKGVTSKNGAQWNNFIEAQDINRSDYKKKCRKAIVESKYLPYVAKGSGIESISIECPCGEDVTVPELADTSGECLWCDRRIYNLENPKEEQVLKIEA